MSRYPGLPCERDPLGLEERLSLEDDLERGQPTYTSDEKTHRFGPTIVALLSILPELPHNSAVHSHIQIVYSRVEVNHVAVFSSSVNFLDDQLRVFNPYNL
jgi:hypothetical protein